MFNMQACYSPADMIFVVSLFILVMFAVGAFIVLMVNLIKSALDEVKDMKKNREVINTQ